MPERPGNGQDWPDDSPQDGPRGGPQQGSVRPTSGSMLAAWALVGVAAGRLLRPFAEQIGDSAPVVTWAQPLALLLVAAILAVTAHATWRSVHVRHERLAPHQAVNRLVLARACSLVGALVAGGYAGYALAWLGDGAELAEQRIARSLIAVLAGVATVLTALLLERACRVRSDDSQA